DQKLIEFMKIKGLHPEDVDLLPEGGGFLLVEFGGDDEAKTREDAERFIEAMEGLDEAPTTKLVEESWEQEKLWQVREAGLGATARVPGRRVTHPGWEDSAVAPDQVGDY